MPMMVDITPFEVQVGDAEIEDVRDRLRRTRWPEAESVDDWSQGVPLAYAQDLARWWADEYDMGLAGRVNAFPQVRAEIDGLGIHAVHVRSPEQGALPLLITHGWPGTVVEFLEVFGPLADPGAHGGDPADAFHVVAPSLPGYGWSDKPTSAGWGLERIARTWDELMRGLGYSRYVAQGGDWGAGVTTVLAQQAPDGLAAIHLNMPLAFPAADAMDDLTETETRALADLAEHAQSGMGYSSQQSTRPQTLGYGLTDSPAGQLAWIVEKFWAWTDCGGHPEGALTRQQMLDGVSAYWFTASAASSARLYWESFGRLQQGGPVTVPTGVTVFPREIVRPSRRWAEKVYTNLCWFEEVERGGHFAAFEQPGTFVDQLRGCFRPFR
jgi:pimeloyl-ACP methyl ester carboxylesterase